MSNSNDAQNYIMNEETQAEEIIKNESVKPNVYKVIDLLSKYLRIGKDMKKIDIENYIIDFLEKNYINFHIVQTPELVETRVGRDWRRKDGYRMIESIKVMVNELEHIRSIDNIILEKIMFVMLVEAKRNNIASGGTSGKWTSRKLEDLLKDAKLHGTYERKFLQTSRIEGLDGFGVLSNKRVDANSYEILFSDISYSGDVAFELVDMREYVLEYLRWRGENIGMCEECGIRIEKVNNSNIYCASCGDRLRKKTINENAKKYYHQNKK